MNRLPVVGILTLSLACGYACKSNKGSEPASASASAGSTTPPQSQVPARPTRPAPAEPSRTPAKRPTLLSIESVPPGASVEIGLKTINNIATPGTGRNVGSTPLTVELKQTDLSPFGGVDGIVRYPGYFDHYFNLGLNSRLEPGKTHQLSLTLKRVQ
jgi:hypothetical protein